MKQNEVDPAKDHSVTSAEANRPALRVVRGEPTPEELAAMVVVLSASGSAEPEAAEPPRTWSAYWRSVRRPLPPGPNAWRASGRPNL